MSNILVLGASGYIGARLSYLLAHDGNRVTALCYPEPPNDKEWLAAMEKVIVGDVTSDNVIDEITNQKYDSAIHLISLDQYDSNKQPAIVNSINVMPVWNVLEAFKTKKTLKQFIYFSTIHVYGRIANIDIEEKETPSPVSAYGLTHLLAENINNMYQQTTEIDCVNIRLSNSYGSPLFGCKGCWSLAVNDFCRSAYENKKISLTSNGSALRDFIHYKDIFNAIKQVIGRTSTKSKNNTFHLSSGSTRTIFQIAQEVQRVFQKRYGQQIPIVLPLNMKPPQNSSSVYIIHNERLKSLGFEVQYAIEEGINELFDFLEKGGKN